jgi:hypothetical protein
LVRNVLFWVLLVLILFPVSGPAESFKNPQLIATSSTPNTVIEGDINGDGRPDLVYSDINNSVSTVHVLLNQGNGAFPPGQNIVGPTTGFVTSAIADVNSDGRPDLVLIFSGIPAEIAVALGNGDGTFQPLVLSALPSYSSNAYNPSSPDIKTLAVADLNGDGIQDVIFSDVGNDLIWICVGDNTGHFTQKTELNDQNPSSMIFLGDFNRDGKTDVIGYEHLAGRAAVYLGTGNATFAPPVYYGGPDNIGSMLVKDMDGDGQPDMVITGFDNVLRVLHGNSDGTFTATLSLPVPVAANGMYPTLLDIQDFNHDGTLDMALESLDGVHILIGQGGFNFSPFQPAPVSSFPGPAAIGDLNQDTNIDFVFPVSGGLAILYGKPDGSLRSADAYDLRYIVSSATLADFNGDGKTDVAAGVDAINPRILTGNGDGTFTLLPDTNSISGETNNRGQVSSGDFNGDGHADLISTNGYPFPGTVQGVVYELGKGDGTFGPPTSLPGYDSSEDTGSAIGDLNNDGLTDIAATGYIAEQNFLLGQANGTFLQKSTVLNDLAAGAFWVYGDFNKDGNLDTAIIDDGDLQVENGNGDGTFQPGFAYKTARGPGAAVYAPADAVVVDLDGDGNLDIAAPIGFQILVFYGHGDGTFDPPVYISLTQPLPSTLEPTPGYGAINAADFNRDGIMDLVLSNGELLTVLHGMGNRTFGPSINYLAGDGPAKPLIADFNHDGYPDILLANNDVNNASTITVLLNIPDAGDFSGALTVDPEPSVFPQPFTIHLDLSAAVAGSGTPSGTASFSIDGTSIGNATLNNGSAAFTVNSAVPVGTHTISVLYSGDSVFHAATFTGQHTVILAAILTQTILTAAPNPSSFGLPVVLTATVTSGNAVQGGTITFKDGSAVLGSGAISQGGVATFTTTSLQVGTHALTAAYSGATGFQSSVSNTVQLLIQGDATGTTLTATPNPAGVGTNVTFTASVSNTTAPMAAAPTGTVTFLDGTVALGQAALNGSGVATYSTSSLAVGTHLITAAYPGTTNTLPGVSAAVQEVILPFVGDFTLQVSPGSASLYTGAAANLQVTVSAINGFDQNVALACTGLTAATTCLFKPASIAGGNGAATLTLQTSPPHQIAATDGSPLLPWQPAAAAVGGFVSLAFLVLPRRMRLSRSFLMMLLGLFLAIAMGACGGPGPVTGGTPPGTYNISVTGTASQQNQTLSHSATVKLTVKSFF